MKFSETTSYIIMIILMLSFIISIPLLFAALFVSPKPKLVNGKTIYTFDTKKNLAIAGGVLFLVPLFFLSFLMSGGTKLFS